MDQKEEMKLRLSRVYLKEDYTIGKLFVDDSFLCDTLEDKVRDLHKEEKVDGKTAIPYGIYRVIMSYSDRFQRIMPEILDVPYFTHIRIHAGNTTASTEGCPLVGKNTEKGKLTYSRHYSDILNNLLSGLNEKIFIEIV